MRRDAVPLADPAASNAGCAGFAVSRWRAEVCAEGRDLLVEEVPVALVYNGVGHAVMLASPLDLEDFAVGFSLSENVVRNPGEVYDIEVEAASEGIEVRLAIAGSRMAALKERRRALAGRTGCGLCGIESLRQLAPAAAAVWPGGSVAGPALHRALAGLGASQVLHRATGAAHAAGWAGWSGETVLVREDVGRHNALDKLIGAMARQAIDPCSGFAVVTSRASYEMVQKTASAGIGLLAAMSAPTAMAVRVAEQAGMSLVGFASHGNHVVYAHPQRLRASGHGPST